MAVYDRRVVSALVIRLLGPPEIERDGVIVAPPRGHKAWAVLAYVVLAERPVPRTQLAGLVFGDADDPRGALRWTLAQLRRALGVAGALQHPRDKIPPMESSPAQVTRVRGPAAPPSQ